MAVRIDIEHLSRSISEKFRDAIGNTPTGRIIDQILLDTTRNHIRNRYPGSTHWSPDKVRIDRTSTDSGSIAIDIPGASRAFHDVVIRPINANWLTIPIVSSFINPRGKKASDIDGLFRPKDKNILAKVMDGQLVAVFALAKMAFQPQDPSLLPSDSTYQKAIEDNWIQAVFKRL